MRIIGFLGAVLSQIGIMFSNMTLRVLLGLSTTKTSEQLSKIEKDKGVGSRC